MLTPIGTEEHVACKWDDPFYFVVTLVSEFSVIVEKKVVAGGYWEDVAEVLAQWEPKMKAGWSVRVDEVRSVTQRFFEKQ